MTAPSLAVSRRTLESAAKVLRRKGIIPGVLYGHKVGNLPIACEEKVLERVLQSAARGAIIELQLEHSTLPALVQDVQRNPVSDRVIHVDFHAIDLSKKVRTKIQTVPVGISPAVKEFEGVLIHQMQQVEVECLPQDLPKAIEVDISGLLHFHDKITIADLRVGRGMRILEEDGEVVFTVVPPREEKEEEVPAVVEAAAEVTEGGAVTPEGAEAADAAKKTEETKKEGEPTKKQEKK
jgi:large subunit ribosomal protein L25